MNVCKNCIYWEKITDVHSNYIIREFYGKCSCEKFVYGEHNAISIDGLAYEDAESYAATFCTGALFGCVNFIKREEVQC